jgi:hypothetical protein
MNLQEWRNRGEDVVLPSGLEARLRAVNVLDLAVSGKIPAPLMEKLQPLVTGSGRGMEMSLEMFTDFAPALNELAKLAMVEPPVADVPDEEHLGVEELSGMDRLFIFKWAHEAAGGADLSKFRPGPEQPVVTAQPGEPVRDETEQDPGGGE